MPTQLEEDIEQSCLVAMHDLQSSAIRIKAMKHPQTQGFNRQGTRIPQVIVTLSPTGDLQAEVAGHNGNRQVIHIPPGQCEDTLHRILKGQALASAQEAWAIMQASRNGKPYEDQLIDLSARRAAVIKAKRHYALVESQVGLLPVVKTTKSGKAKTTTQPKHYHANFSDL